MGTTHELTGNLRDVIPGGVSTVHAAYIRTNVPDGEALVDTTTEGGVAPSNTGRISLVGDVFALELLGTNNTGLNVTPGTLRYQVVVEYGKPGVRGLFTWQSVWFELTEDANLKTVVGELELVAPSTVADLLSARIDSLEQGGLGGGGGALIVSAGGTVNLDETLPPGTLVGYRFTGPATVEGIALSAGGYVFERNTTSPSGWTYRSIAEGADLPLPDSGGGDPGAPTETTPQQPTWNDGAMTYTIANTTGVQYKKAGVNIAAGSYDATSAEAVTITASPKAGYVFPTGVATSWSHTFPTITGWTTSFSDPFASPVGPVTSRTGWTFSTAGLGADEIGIEDTGNLYMTGTTIAESVNPTFALKHFVECYYDLSTASTGIEHLYLDVAWGFQPHRFTLTRQSGGARLDQYASGVPVVTGLALTGVLRAESDGTYVRAFLDGVQITEGPYDPGLVSGETPNKSRIIVKGAPNSGARFRVKNIAMGTRP